MKNIMQTCVIRDNKYATENIQVANSIIISIVATNSCLELCRVLIISLQYFFIRVIPDDGPAAKNQSEVKKLIFCSGKVYYDLTAARKEAGLEDVIAISRVEQVKCCTLWCVTLPCVPMCIFTQS